MQLYYSEEITNDKMFLNKEESHHLVNVMRIRTNDEVAVTDGKGKAVITKLIMADQKYCTLEYVRDLELYSHSYYLHIAVAPTKNIDRFEWFLEKAVECGINEVTPVLMRHSERKVINYDRLQKLVIAAAKQSLKVNFPVLNELVPLTDFLKNDFKGNKYIALCENGIPSLGAVYSKSNNVTILVGPEGDFHNEEIKAAANAGFSGVSLGNYRLRTETAALMACNTISVINQL